MSSKVEVKTFEGPFIFAAHRDCKVSLMMRSNSQNDVYDSRLNAMGFCADVTLLGGKKMFATFELIMVQGDLLEFSARVNAQDAFTRIAVEYL